jgi:hypothetical protein
MILLAQLRSWSPFPANDYLSVSRFLTACAEEHLVRGQRGPAIRLFRTQHALGKLLFNDADDSLKVSISSILCASSSSMLCEVALSEGMQPEALAWLEATRQTERERQTIVTAAKREARQGALAGVSPKQDRIMELFITGTFKVASIKGDAERQAEIDRVKKELEELSGDIARFIVEQEQKIRPYLERLVDEGERKVLLSFLTEEDRGEISRSKHPIDALWESREVLYPKAYGPREREALVSRLNPPAPGSEKQDSEVRTMLCEAAERALVHHERGGGEALRGELARQELTRHPLLANAGYRDDEVLRSLAKDIESGGKFASEAIRGVARLGLKTHVPKLVELLGEARRENERDAGSAIPLLYALRDLTGENFELDADQWRRWLEKNAKRFE